MKRSAATVGTLAALGAFGIWGFVPAFFKLLKHVDPGVVIAHRVLWTLVIIGLWQALRYRRRLGQSMRLAPRTLLGLMASGTLVACNWLTFVWAVNNDQVLATSLGYFINPLVSVLLGMVFLHERLSAYGWTAVILAAAGTLFLGISLGQPPWVALILAFCFGGYGLIRKMLNTGSLTGLWWETAWLAVPSLWWIHQVDGVVLKVFAPYDATTAALLVGAGVVTLVPLALFATAARHLPLSTVGLFQYLAPSISFLLAVFLFDETFTRAHAIAFACIWVALAIYTLGPRLARRRRRMPV